MTCPHIVNLEKILVSIETFLQRELKITRICTFLQGHMVCLVLYHVGHMQYLMVFPSCRSAPENIFGAAMEFAGQDAAKTGEPQLELLEPKKNFDSKNWALAMVYLACFVDGLSMSLTYPVMPLFVKKLGGGPTILGGMFGTFALFATVSAMVSGLLSDRIGRRPVLLASLFGSGLGMLTSGLAPTYKWLFPCRALLGLFSGTMPVANAYIGDISRPQDRSRLMAITGAAQGIT